MDCINLKTVARQMFDDQNESEGIIVDSSIYEDQLENFYKQCKTKFAEIMAALNFAPELLKEEEKTEKPYTIPRRDAEFVAWCIEQYTDEKMKAVRKGDYYIAGTQYIYKLIMGFKDMLIHLEKRDIVIDAQMDLMCRETDYPLMVRFENFSSALQFAYMNMFKIMHAPGMYMPWEQRWQTMDEIVDAAKEFDEKIQKIAGDRFKEAKNNLIENGYSIPIHQNPERLYKIYEELYSIEEFVELKSKLDEISESKDFLEKYRKRRTKIVNRMNEIFQSVVKKYPIDLDEISDIEKIMLVADGPFSLKYFSGEDRIYIDEDVMPDRYYRRFWFAGPSLGEDDAAD